MSRKQAPTLERPSLLPAQPNRSLIDGLAVLSALAVSREPIGSRELARRLGWNPMRVNRLLRTLAAVGMAHQTADRRYTAGPAMHVLSVQAIYASGLFTRAMAAVEMLPRDRHGVALGVLWQDQVCYLFHAKPGEPLASAVGAHGLYPATQSSIGMVLLAAMAEQQVRELFASRPIVGYEQIDDLLRDLRLVREDGYACVVQQRRPRQASVAVPIGEPAYAALALTHDIRKRNLSHLLPALKRTAAAIAG